MTTSSDPISQARRRRTFAIISHPDAGKTTVTEKLLLYSGAIEQAGAVKARAGRQKDVTSDWMELERERGISITSTALQFNHANLVFNLLDTPGHRDFSEDTYRVLSAVDSAVIVLDAARGIQEQTLKLFHVAQARGIPLITFINKCDRPGLSPLELIDDIESQLGIVATPVTWPVGGGVDFEGVIDRRNRQLWEFDRTPHGGTRGAERVRSIEPHADDNEVRTHAWHDVELLDEIGARHDQEAFEAGASTPVFFGSALWNFGIRLLLDAIAGMAPPPAPQADAAGQKRALDGPVSGTVFKVQANLDPRHRDRIAYVRVCSGRFERGMSLINHRTGKSLTTKHAHSVFGRERDTVEEAFPGDIVGLINATDVTVGDSLSLDGDVEFPPMPVFAPELFRTARSLDTSKAKRFRTGIDHLDQEGVIQVLRTNAGGDREPILGAVGQMQFDVALHRLENEFGAKVIFEATPYTVARRTTAGDIDLLGRLRDVAVARRANGEILALFTSRHRVESTLRTHPDLTLEPILGP